MNNYKKMQVIMLPTQTSDLLKCIKDYHVTNTNEVGICGKLVLGVDKYANKELYQSQHLYIVSDNHIKEGDYFINGNELYLCNIVVEPGPNAKKLEATTDMLPRPGTGAFNSKASIPQIPKYFIDIYIEADGKIDEVNVEIDILKIHNKFGNNITEKIVKVNYDNTITIKLIDNQIYTKEEVIKLCSKAFNIKPNYENILEEFNKWIENNL